MQRYTGPPLHPIDHGWSWMVCLGAFVCNLFVNGGTRSMGLLLVQLVSHFKAEPSVASAAIGLVAAGFAIFAALGNGFGVVITNRVVVLVGSTFMFTGMIATAYAPNIYVVIIFLGLFSGMGYGFLFGPSMVSVGQYFVKRRSLANGLAVAGGSVGQLVLPIFLNAAIEEYGFSGGLLLYSGMMLHSIPAALLLRPPHFYHSGKAMAEYRREEGLNNNSRKDEVKNREEDEDHEQHIYSSTTSSLEHIPMQDPIELDEIKETGAPESPPPRPTLGMICCMICHKLFDRKLLSNCMFLFVAIGVSLGQGGYLNVCFLMPPYMVALFKSNDLAALVIAVMGISDLVGRIAGGFFSDLHIFSIPAIIGFSFIFCGTITILMPLYPIFPVIMTFTVLYGLVGGTYIALLAVVVVDLFGLENLPSGMGLSTLMMGLAIIPMPTIMSVLAKATMTFSVPLRTCGGLMVAGGLCYYLVAYMKWSRARPKKAETSDAEVQVKPSDFFTGQQSPDWHRESHI